jgi:hypothetical protein
LEEGQALAETGAALQSQLLSSQLAAGVAEEVRKEALPAASVGATTTNIDGTLRLDVRAIARRRNGSVVISGRLRSRYRIGHAISDVASEAVAT